MFKRIKQIGLAISLVVALMCSGQAYAQTPASIPPPTSITPIQFLPDTSSYTFTTNLSLGVSNGYRFWAAAKQSLYITKSGDANAEVLDPLGNILAAPTLQPGPWGTTTTRNGDYTLILYGQGSVTVSIYIPPAYYPQTYSTIIPYPRQWIHFSTGASSYFFNKVFQQGLPLAFLLGVSGGQQLEIWTKGDITVAVLGLDYKPLPAASPKYGEWQFNIPLTGNYTLILSGTGLNWISIAIPPFGANPLPSDPTRIQFSPGTVSLTIRANEQNGFPAPQYLLGIAAGQTLYISTIGNVWNLQVFDSLGNPFTSFVMPNGSLGFYIPQTGEYRVVVYGLGMIEVTFYIPSLW